MTRYVRTALLAALTASTGTGCLLFSDPINSAPSVSLKCPDSTLVAPGEIACPDDRTPDLVRKDYVFEAVASDPDQSADSLQFAWFLGKTCATAALQVAPPHSTFPYHPVALEPGCVQVVVTDSQGASATASQAFAVVDRPPTAAIEVVTAGGVSPPQPGQALALPLFAKATLTGKSPTGKSSTDPDDDALDYHWSVFFGDAALSMPGCPDPAKQPYLCTFAAGTPGAYRVELVVSDSSDLKSPPAVQTIQVAGDQPPRIVLETVQPSPPLPPDGTPLQLLAGVANTFKVNQVEDDGDPYPSADPGTPYPAAPAGFLWFYQGPGDTSFSRLTNANGASFTIGADPRRALQRIRLRVEYRDRVTACQPRTPTCNAVFDSCDPLATVCYSSDLRAQWVTWTVDFR